MSCLCNFTAWSQEKPVVKIGAILSLTGNMGFLGEAARDGILMAKEDLGKTKFDYQIIFEDDQMDGKQTAAAAQKLINVDKVDVLISFTSGSGNVASPMAERAQVVHFGVASDPNVAKGKYNFTHWTPPQEEGRALAKIFGEKKLHRIAVFVFNQQGSQATLDAVKKAVQGTDIKIVFLSTINPGERDFRLLINKAQQAKPDVYLLSMFSPELEILTKQLNEQNITQPITSIESFGYSSNPELFEGRWFIDAADMPQETQEKFFKKYGHKSTSCVGNVYDIVKMVAYVCEHSPSLNKPTNDEMVQALHKLNDFDGMLGKLSVDEQGIIHSKPTLKEIRNGKPTTIQRDL